MTVYTFVYVCTYTCTLTLYTCIYIYIYIHICIYIYMYVYNIQICICVCMDKDWHSEDRITAETVSCRDDAYMCNIYTHIYIYLHVYSIHKSICVIVYIYTFMYICTYRYIFMYVCKYIGNSYCSHVGPRRRLRCVVTIHICIIHRSIRTFVYVFYTHTWIYVSICINK